MDTDPANEAAIRFFSKQGFRNPREHVYLTLDLASHDYYGKLLEYERDRAEQLTQILRHRYQ